MLQVEECRQRDGVYFKKIGRMAREYGIVCSWMFLIRRAIEYGDSEYEDTQQLILLMSPKNWTVNQVE